MEISKRAKKLLNTGNIALGILALAGFFAVTASIEAMQRNYTLRREVTEETRLRHQLELEIAELEYQGYGERAKSFRNWL